MGDIEGERLCLRGGGCGATVRWVVTVNHRRLDLDVTPNPNGNVIIVEQDDGRVRAKVLCGPEMPAQQEAFRMHQCRKPKPPGIPCAGCHLPMPRDIALLEKWTHHPGCEPGFQLRLAQDRLRERKQR